MTMSAPSDHDPASADYAEVGSSRGSRFLVLVVAGILLVMAVRAFLAQPYAVGSESMSPTLAQGERVLVAKVGAVSVGDVVVADVTEAFPGGAGAASSSDPGTEDDAKSGLERAVASAALAVGVNLDERSVVSRVVATAGQRVTCCDGSRVAVNGAAVGPELPSTQPPFRIVVPQGRVFLLSDNPESAVDSRTHLGAGSASTDGTVSESALVGRVFMRVWPLGSVDTESPTAPRPDTTPSTIRP